MIRSALLLCLWYLAVTPAAAQDFGWWNTANDWDGVSHWRHYLTLSPAFLGPNALPVPEVQSGRMDTITRLAVAADAHYSSGDRTTNAFLELFRPLFSDRAALRLWYVPLEFYRMDPATRDARAARDFDGRGTASGDVYVGTHVQLLRDQRRWPDLLLTLNFRTASGTQLSAARHTDTPGYFFDLSAGKTLALGGRGVTVRPFVATGFYVWQLFSDQHLQNDAWSYGAGAELTTAGWRLTPSLAGYAGYLNDGDRPLVARLTLQTNRRRTVEYQARLQHGLHDFGYSSLRLGMVIRPSRQAGSKQ